MAGRWVPQYLFVGAHTEQWTRYTVQFWESQPKYTFFPKMSRLDGVATGVLQGYSTTTTTSKPTGYNYSTLTLLWWLI